MGNPSDRGTPSGGNQESELFSVEMPELKEYPYATEQGFDELTPVDDAPHVKGGPRDRLAPYRSIADPPPATRTTINDSFHSERTVANSVPDVSSHDLVSMLRQISAMKPETRQQLKHHMALYEQHDMRALEHHHEGSPCRAVHTEIWKEHLKSRLRKDEEKVQKTLQLSSGYESLNYAGVDDHIISREHQAEQAEKGHHLEKFLAWCVFIVIGLLTGVTAFFVKVAEEFLGHWRLELVEQEIVDGHLWTAFLYNWGISVLFATGAVVLTLFAPQAAGSGVPDVKALLNGVRIRGMLGLRTYLVKVLGVVLGVASGLAMGPEGPMIHAGAILAGGISQATLQWPFRYRVKLMQLFRNDTFKRDAISAGAAAGVAAAFGAPIGGLLFSMEEASSYWSASTTWRTMISCLFATFTMMILVYGGDRFNDPGLVHFGVAENTPSRYQMWEMVFWVPLAILGGLLGAFFNMVSVRKIAFVNRLRKEWQDYWAEKVGGPRTRKAAFAVFVIVEAWLVMSIVAAGNFNLARAGKCQDTPLIDIIDSEGNYDGLSPQEAACDGGGHGLHFLPFECENITLDLDKEGSENHHYNDLATLSLLPQLDVIRNLLSRDTLPSGSQDLFMPAALATYFVVYFTFTVLTAGLFIPQGLFVPHIVIGALGGRLYGSFVHSNVDLDAQPGTYALMGAAAMLAGASRITVSLAVILFEITNDIQYLIPIMLVVVVARNVGSLFNEPYYDALLEMRHIPVLEEEPPESMHLFHVGDLMSSEPKCCHRFSTLGELAAHIRETKHASFPVIRSADDSTLLGTLSREAINIILSAWEETRTPEQPGGCVAYRKGGVPSPPIPYGDWMDMEDTLRTTQKRDFDASLVDDESCNLFVDILPYTNLSTFIVTPTFNLATAFEMFRSMGLRHIVVVNTAHAPIGIVTRNELHKHFTYVWSQRQKKQVLTHEALQQVRADQEAPSPVRRAQRMQSMHDIIEQELDANYGAPHGPPPQRYGRTAGQMGTPSTRPDDPP